MGNQRRFESRSWASVECAQARAVKVWGEAGLTAFRAAAGTRTSALFREALESLAQVATTLEDQIRAGLGEMKRAERRLSGRHVLPKDARSYLSIDSAQRVIRESAAPTMKTLSQVADALAKLHRDASNIESALKSARVEMTSLVARIRRDVPNAPLEPAEWGYAAIAVGFFLPCESTAEFRKNVFGPFRKALSGVVSKAA